jgi:hypothetical protein
LATIEFKAHVGPSFGNNFNNRTEEALGSAADFSAAYREGAFRGSPRPWLGYLMLLEDSINSKRPFDVAQTHFQVFEEFRGASYAKRYEILLTKLARDRMYDAAGLILLHSSAARGGQFHEPCEELTVANIAESLVARAVAHARTQG